MATQVSSQELDKLEFLLSLTTEVARTPNLNEALEKLVSLAASALNAERATVFLHDNETDELYSIAKIGDECSEIRFMNNTGIAGWTYVNHEPVIINNAYDDSRFNELIDETTGYKTKNIISIPFTNWLDESIGVFQVLNKRKGRFTKADLKLITDICKQSSVFLQNKLILDKVKKKQKKEQAFLKLISEISTEIKLGPLLEKIITAITALIDAERSTLFINDEKNNELFTKVGEGLGEIEIRFPNNVGIAGSVFTTGETINIPHAYADLRFNPEFDKQTGFFTRSILCVPVRNNTGKIIGVTQVLNKKGGTFNQEDESRLSAFTSQISMGIENATLFDNMQNIKNYNQAILESMVSAVVTIDAENKIKTCNDAGFRLFNISAENNMSGKHIEEFFGRQNKWLTKAIKENNSKQYFDAELLFDEKLSVNITLEPLIDVNQESMGMMIMIEDITNEKRMKSTMSRYMDPELADSLLTEDSGLLGGNQTVATVLFSDVRSFTTITEMLGAEGTVSLLNEYFTLMVDCIQKEGGMLDKFIGDAIMAVFGTPLPHEDDPDRGVRAAISMMEKLNEYNVQRKARGLNTIDHSIGLNTDDIVSGNIGSEKRMDYTVIGDGVNLAARLESACKQYGSSILISEFTFEKLKATYRTRMLDRIIVKGKTHPVSVYEIIDFHNEETFPNQREVFSYFEQGMELYKQANWERAITAFSECLKLNKNDKSAQVYIDRCNQLKKQKIGDDWDGVWTLTSK